MKSTLVKKDRYYEPIASCLIRALIVPKIYFKKHWHGSDHSDIIAVDHAGTGDIHVVKICNTLDEALNEGVKALFNIPSHYRWIAYQGEGLAPYSDTAELKLISQETLFPSSGMGRVGVIEIVLMSGNNIGANIKVKSERFETDEDIFDSIKEFVNTEKVSIKINV